MVLDTFVWKVASRCNLDCSYCYVYNAGDTGWRSKPALMPEHVARRAALRIREHALRHGLERVVINFHGGEPLLGGTRHLGLLLSILEETFQGSGIHVSSALQTNALLFTPEIGELLAARGVGLYVSLDGPPEINDLSRRDRRGRPTGAAVERSLALLTSERFRKLFSGFLCVIDPGAEPSRVLDYLLQFQPPVIDFLLPLLNHERPPAGRSGQFAEWLISCFDHWFNLDTPTRVRTFDTLMTRLLSPRTALALQQSAALIIETDGSLEADDTLKTAFPGAAVLGYDIFRHGLEEVAVDPRVAALQGRSSELAPECQRCELVSACGGGHLSHRYSKARGFLNPSVYCTDLQALILHIHHRLREQLQPASALHG